jgi:formate dehydrogenase beta subunit/formate dehydrogenase gamma subunit
MSVSTLEIVRSSASLRGEKTGARHVPVVAKFIDTTTCIGCKACEVACQEWNDLPRVHTEQVGTYQTMPGLHHGFWNLIKFHEQQLEGREVGNTLAWLMRKDQCMHCADPGCLAACPAPGAIVQYANGIVDVNPDACIGCGLCETGCPFNVPRLHSNTGKMAKCTLCVDRVQVGLEPACIKACPTGCLQFGTKEDMVAMGNDRVAQLKAGGFPNASLYDPAGVDGTSVVTVLAHGDHPEWYELPADPKVPVSVMLTKSVLKPLGMFGIFATVAATVGHYLGYGPKVPRDVNGLNGPAVPAVGPVSVTASARRNEDIVVGGEIVRHRLSSRVIHWSVALFFFLALFTGMPIWSPVFGWMASLFGGLAVCRWLHAWMGIVFFVAVAVMFIHWFGDMRLGKQDKGWMGRKMLDYFRYRDHDPDVGKYNGGQKLLLYVAAILAVLMLASGIVLWWPELMSQPLREVSWVVHDAIFILFVITIIGHIYLATAMEPGTFRSMTRGTVTKQWARLHHPRWYREVTGDRDSPPSE